MVMKPDLLKLWGMEGRKQYIYIYRERSEISLVNKGTSIIDFHDSCEHFTYKAEKFFFRSGNHFSSDLSLMMLNDC